MKHLLLLLVVILMSASLAIAGSTKTYQVTGPVLELKPDSITVQKGQEKWEIARDKDTQVTGDLKEGAKVTIMYQMKATSIEAKGGAPSKEKKK